jgi:hypothetical protein
LKHQDTTDLISLADFWIRTEIQVRSVSRAVLRGVVQNATADNRYMPINLLSSALF